jgi:hypothetical protein
MSTQQTAERTRLWQFAKAASITAWRRCHDSIFIPFPLAANPVCRAAHPTAQGELGTINGVERVTCNMNRFKTLDFKIAVLAGFLAWMITMALRAAFSA